MDKDGNMIPASESLNTVEVNGTKYAKFIIHLQNQIMYMLQLSDQEGCT